MMQMTISIERSTTWFGDVAPREALMAAKRIRSMAMNRKTGPATSTIRAEGAIFLAVAASSFFMVRSAAWSS